MPPGSTVARRFRGRSVFIVAALMLMSGDVAAFAQTRQHSLRRNRSGRDPVLPAEEPDGRPRRVPGRLAELCRPRLAPRDDRGLRQWQDQAHVQPGRRTGHQVRLSRQWCERVRLREVQEGAAPRSAIRTTTTATMVTGRAIRSPSREPSSPPTRFTLHVNKGDKHGRHDDRSPAPRRSHGVRPASARHRSRTEQIFTNPNGSHSTYSTRDGAFLDTANAFFQPLGTNGRACVSCHQVEDAMGLSAAHVQARFEGSCGLEPDLPAR